MKSHESCNSSEYLELLSHECGILVKYLWLRAYLSCSSMASPLADRITATVSDYAMQSFVDFISGNVNSINAGVIPKNPDKPVV